MTNEELERKTRKQRIDPRLRKADWTILPFERDQWGSAPVALEEHPTANGPVDYALLTDGIALGLVEAKKVGRGPEGVLTQTERYSRGFPANVVYDDGYHVPFIYSSNGVIIWFRDVRHPMNRARMLSDFHTPTGLEELLARDLEGALAELPSVPYHSLLRPYQIEAHQAIEDGLLKRKRHMLLAMATGTGKTLTMVSQVYRLLKAGVAKRVLFLVDRRALAAQAVRAFASFEAEPGKKFDSLYEVYSQRFQKEDFDEDEPFDPKVLPKSYLTNPGPGQTFVYVSTIQRMSMNLFGRGKGIKGEGETEEDADLLNIPIHAFDIVIADECHRGYTSSELSVWRDTLSHFDAVNIGLTATPAAHTVAYFKEPIYRYEYERAVREGHLVDYDVVRIKSNVRVEGVFLEEGQGVEVVDTATGTSQLDLLEDERSFDSSEIEKKITAPDSNQRILEEVKKYADEHKEKFGRWPKTLIFADNDLEHRSHADQVVRLTRDIFGEGEAFVTKITGRVDRPLREIRKFRNRPKPAVAVTVDLLSTGIDIPDLEFIVFMRMVKSRILFAQMMGRGTRKGEKFPDKSHFTVFDCFDGTLLEYFRAVTDITAELPEPEATPVADIIEAIWANRDRDYNVKRLAKRLRRVEKQMSSGAREKFARFIANGDVGAFAHELPTLINNAFAPTMGILRSPEFQDLLVNYERAAQVFLVSYETRDVVTSEWMIRGDVGQQYKPEEYLQAFERFVRESSDEIDAIAIILSKPERWGTGALEELRTALRDAPEHFTEDNLRRAFEIAHKKPLIDIISMVKRAAAEQSPLLTAEERVEAALTHVVAGRELDAEQMKWLDHIRQHLVLNLSIDREDFENMPVLLNRGGWGRANKVFRGELEDILKDVNRELVAA